MSYRMGDVSHMYDEMGPAAAEGLYPSAELMGANGSCGGLVLNTVGRC